VKNLFETNEQILEEGKNALQRTLLMINYDMKKTLTENVKVISEQEITSTSLDELKKILPNGTNETYWHVGDKTEVILPSLEVTYKNSWVVYTNTGRYIQYNESNTSPTQKGSWKVENGKLLQTPDSVGIFDDLKKVLPKGKLNDNGQWVVNYENSIVVYDGASLLPSLGQYWQYNKSNTSLTEKGYWKVENGKLLKTPRVKTPNNTSETSDIIKRDGDPYEYKVESDNWLARKIGKEKWFNITDTDFKTSYQKSIDILDTENPKSRTENAPKRTK
jgi:hypothetical protein